MWQTTFWILGVMIVWWLAYRGQLSTLSVSALREGELRSAQPAIGAPTPPRWIELLLARIAGRDHLPAARRSGRA
jgi:hypothetical protein